MKTSYLRFQVGRDLLAGQNIFVFDPFLFHDGLFRFFLGEFSDISSCRKNKFYS